MEGEEYKYNVNINVTHRIWLDAVAQGMTYDTHTGVRTYQPANVNGNWELINNIYMMYRLVLDRKRQNWLNADLRTIANYRNNVDLISLDGMSSSVRTACVRSPGPSAPAFGEATTTGDTASTAR